MLLTTYLNPAALTGKAGRMPNDAFIVKENYTAEGEFAANTVMYNKEGYNPHHNDWFWLKVLADGTVGEGRASRGLPRPVMAKQEAKRLYLDRSPQLIPIWCLRWLPHRPDLQN